MRVRMKLTTLCDKDLLTLNSILAFNFRIWIRDTLCKYASTGEIRKTPLPTAPPDKPILKNIMFSINFDETKDDAIVGLLNAVQNRLRSGLIKSILRSSLTRPCLYAYFNDYPAPFSATHPGVNEPVKQIIKQTISNSNPLPAVPGTLPEQASEAASGKFDLLGFKDELG